MYFKIILDTLQDTLISISYLWYRAIHNQKKEIRQPFSGDCVGYVQECNFLRVLHAFLHALCWFDILQLGRRMRGQQTSLFQPHLSSKSQGKPQLSPRDPISTPFLDIPSSILSQSEQPFCLASMSYPPNPCILSCPAHVPHLPCSLPGLTLLSLQISPSSGPVSSPQPSGLLFTREGSQSEWVFHKRRGKPHPITQMCTHS